METHAAGSTQSSEDGGEDADEGLENELPEVLLGIIAGDHNGLHIGVRHCVGNRLLDKLLNELAEQFLHNCKCLIVYNSVRKGPRGGPVRETSGRRHPVRHHRRRLRCYHLCRQC